ncbi:unnamed protein product, partial [Polarella glacialis]
ENGRRAKVRTKDGFTGWISLYTSDSVPIVRRVRPDGQTAFASRRSATTEVARPPRSSSRSSLDKDPVFKDAFEKKWQKLRVDPIAPEGTPLIVRRGSPGVRTKSWRPTGTSKEPMSTASRPVQQELIPVPKLNAPP